MRKIILLFFLTSISIFTSCSSDDDDSMLDIKNEIVYEDSIIIVNQMGIENIDSEPGYSNYFFYLGGMLDEEIIGFNIELKLPIIDDNSNFRPGTFSYSPITDLNSPSFHYNFAELRIGNDPIRVNGGNIIVSKSGTIFTFNGTLTLENGKDFTINYSGDLGMTD
ncbi:hypothetical protein [uncultured Aquimarina sp.]|uniref:hypothetical protein n=1 Tax=uncultured Aquimarina sp. TaxID=575652 RepID=UPI0026152D58|nr:hypothetical protein [uncultured Aquimarina sp.]